MTFFNIEMVLFALRGRLGSSSRAPEFIPGFWWSPCCSSFYCSMLCFCFVSLRLIYFVLNVGSFCGLSILDCPFGLVRRFLFFFLILSL